MMTNVYWCSWKVPVILVRYEWKLNFVDRFSKNIQMPNLTKIRLVGAQLFHADGRMDGRTHRQTDTRKLTVAFRNFTSAPQRSRLIKSTYVIYIQVICVKFHFHLIFILISSAYMTSFRRYIVVKLRLTWFPVDYFNDICRNSN
jgi:Fe-S-cluster formation regulator IscX/YfhJ